jgi:hypothetical protein
MNEIRYYVHRDPDGSVATLARIHDDETGLWGESWDLDGWRESVGVLDFLSDPGYGDLIDEETAAKIISDFGGHW